MGELPRFQKLVSAVELGAIFRMHQPENCVIEKVGAMPGQGVDQRFHLWLRLRRLHRRRRGFGHAPVVRVSRALESALSADGKAKGRLPRAGDPALPGPGAVAGAQKASWPGRRALACALRPRRRGGKRGSCEARASNSCPSRQEGAELLAMSRRAMLVWDPGVGKTPTAVRACVEASARRILVFCPPIGTGVWRQHFEDWSDIPDIQVDGHAPAPSSLIAFMRRRRGSDHPLLPRPVTAARSSSGLSSAPWDVVIIDEAHYLKTPSAQRTRAVYGAKIDLIGLAAGARQPMSGASQARLF